MQVLLFREYDRWVAQGLEYDIAASGETIPEAQEAFIRTLTAQVAGAHHYGQPPLENFEPAPDCYWKAARSAQRLADPIRPTQGWAVPALRALNSPLADCRIYA